MLKSFEIMLSNDHYAPNPQKVEPNLEIADIIALIDEDALAGNEHAVALYFTDNWQIREIVKYNYTGVSLC